MRLEKPCENCGQPFFSYPSANQRFCGWKCRSAFRFKTSGQSPAKQEVTFSCRECTRTFAMKQSFLTEYQKKHGRNPLYCSRNCFYTARKRDTEKRLTFTCANCGGTFSKSRKPGGRIYAQQKYCSTQCKITAQSTQALERFERGDYKRHVKRNGYVWITIPILGRTGRRSIMEHRYVMEKKLGRKLYPEETVHHLDGNRAHNSEENLELFSSRHGPGQRVVDKVAFAIDMLRLYPEFARAAGVELRKIEHAATTAQPLELH